MPDSEHAIPSDGGCGDRTRDLLLAKARTPVHQGTPNGNTACTHAESAAAAATPNQTPPESLPESLPYPGIAAANAQARLERQYEIAAESAARGGMCAGSYAADGLIPWDVLEHYARTLDRSEACHTLRVRHHQAAIAQRHVRTAVSA